MSKLEKSSAGDKKNSIFQNILEWSQTRSINPVILGDPSICLRLHSFFVTSPLADYFDHFALFDNYSEKNFLILVGPLSEIQIDKCKQIAPTMQNGFKTFYIEMPFSSDINFESMKAEVEQSLNFLNLNKILIDSFISLDQIAKVIKEL